MCSCTNWRLIPSSGKGQACVAVRTGALIPRAGTERRACVSRACYIRLVQAEKEPAVTTQQQKR